MIRRAWQLWDHFWFAPVDLFRFSVWRVLLGLAMLWMYLVRAFAFGEFYTDHGLVLHQQAAELIDDFYRPLFFLGNNTITGPLYVALIVATILLILGIGGRLTSFIALMLHLSFVQRNFCVAYGVDLVVSCWLFYLSLAKNNYYLSVWPRRAVGLRPERLGGLASSVALRLLQIQLCVIYGYTGLEKLKGLPWWEGSAIWSVLGNRQLMLADFGFVREWPIAVAMMTFISLAFEIYFPVLVWLKPLRKWVLLLGIFFHLQIACTMGLLAFGLMMVLGYLAFLDDEVIRGAYLRLRPGFQPPQP